jgi:hypothetical protein
MASGGAARSLKHSWNGAVSAGTVPKISSSSRAGKADGQDDSHPGVLLCLVDVDKRAAQLQAGREGRQVVAFRIGETRRDKVGVDVELTEVMKVGACASRPCCVSTDA